ncbi:Uncharacterised protein [Bordetella pertussis]|nr:Uncharacterised protein [Bordetella pertussis]
MPASPARARHAGTMDTPNPLATSAATLSQCRTSWRTAG